MKKVLIAICLMLSVCCFVACNNDVQVEQLPQIESYQLNENGDLIAIFDDGTTQILGNFETAAINVINTIEISNDGFYVLNGIKTTIVATNVFTVSFNSMVNLVSVADQKVKDGYKVVKPKIERVGYTLDGWYCNDEKWSFNSDIVKSDMMLTAVWNANSYNVGFSTGTVEILDDITVEYDSDYSLPILNRIGYTFNGWLYQNKLVTSEKWNIPNDCTLTASWSVNEYEITLNANGGSVETSKVMVQYGEPFTLPVATNDRGVFLGWFLGERQITDENGKSLTNWEFIDNVELTTSWIIELSTIDDLQKLRKYLNGCFELKNDIDISSMQWEPIGEEGRPFKGDIDGCGHSIIGLTITELKGGSQHYGFIGNATEGTICNISFNNINISLPIIQSDAVVGGVVAANEGAELSNIQTSGTIILANHSSSYISYVGGVAGLSVDKIKYCTNNVNVSAKNFVGGIVGYMMQMSNAFMGNCNSGQISGDKNVGGMVGKSSFCFATNCKNTGNIVGNQCVGGLFGNVVERAIIDKSYNTGAITNNSTGSNIYDSAGGLIGSITFEQYTVGSSISITNSYNQGVITCSQSAGGIVGVNKNVSQLTIQNCYNAGNVSGKAYVSGIVGISIGDIKISQCVNFGDLSNSTMVSMMCYTAASSNIVDCYYNCDIRNVDIIQGVKTAEKYAETFYKEQMFWGDTEWMFFDNKYPELKTNK